MNRLHIVPKSARFYKHTYGFRMFSEPSSKFAAEGWSCFSFGELRQRVDSSSVALRSAIRRSLKKGDIADKTIQDMGADRRSQHEGRAKNSIICSSPTRQSTGTEIDAQG